jgi:hypothetical protein
VSDLHVLNLLGVKTVRRNENTLDFTPMDEFMAGVINALEEHGKRAVLVFPPAAGVLIDFAERVANEVVRSCLSMFLHHLITMGVCRLVTT